MDPEAEPLGQFFPLVHVTKNALDALVDERLDAKSLDFLLGVDAQFLADLDFDRQPVRIPATLAIAAEPPHGLVAGEEVLDRPREAVAGVRQAVGRRWTFVEHERRYVDTGGQRFLIDLPFFPEANDFLFLLRQGNRV